MASADRLIEVFNEAKTRPAGAERERFLAECCRDEPQLKEQVLSLLQAHDGAGDFLKHTQFIPAVTPLTEKPGDRIGRYKLLEQIGEGGCGVVYMADQEEPVRRRVALKVIKLGMDTKQVIARFEAERQALAMMDHPNIAKVLDAGATDTGRPFFVMELVRGIKITDYCDQNNLSTNDRLELFIQVCQAIQHAHQKGIIHRDIKPSNILVTQHDDVAVPKVIDFGIAKATLGHLTDKTVFTAFAQFMGTPAYMSPEQAQMSGLDIDTRADIYSLGVLLYELLTGNTPFDAKELLAAGMDEMRRKIREDEPAKPSTCLSTMLAMDLTTVAKHRQVEPPRLIHLIRGDLDWLVMKCLEKDRTRRYETANGLAMDLQRHLDDEPVIARPPSTAYRFQKLVRRNKLAFAATGAVVAALVIGLGISTWMFFKEKHARQRAVAAEQNTRTEAAKSQQVAQFMKDMLKGVGPSKALGRDTTMLKEILDSTARRVGKDLTNQPEVEFELRATLADTYGELGLYAEMTEMARANLKVAQTRLHGEKAVVVRALAQLGTAQWGLGDYNDAERSLRQSLTMQRTMSDSTNRILPVTYYHLGLALWRQGKLSEAETIFREGLAITGKGPENCTLERAALLRGLGLALRDRGKATEAVDLQREALAMFRKLLGNDNPEVAKSLNDLGNSLLAIHKIDAAEAALDEALAMRKRLFGNKHDEIGDTLLGLGNVLVARGKLPEAEAAQREGLEMKREMLGAEHLSVADSLKYLARILASEGKLAEAESAARECLTIREKKGAPRWEVSEAREMLLDNLLRQEKLAEGELLFSQASATTNGGPPLTAALLRSRGAFRARTARWSDAAADFSSAITLEPDNPDSYYPLGPLLVQKGDLSGFRSYRAGCLARFGLTVDPVVAERIVKSCLLLPATDAELRTLSKMADTAVNAGSNNRRWAHFRFAKGLADYRMGQFDSAAAWVKTGLATSNYVWMQAEAEFVLALAAHQTQHAEDARAALEAGTEILDMWLSKLDSAELGGDWKDVLIELILMREAKELIGGQAGQEAIALLNDDQKDFAFRLKLYQSKSPYRLAERASALLAEGKFAEAEPLVREAAQKCHSALAKYEKLASDRNRHQECWSFAGSYEGLGRLFKEIGQTQEAEKAYRDTQILWRKLVADFNLEDDRWHLAINYEALGNLLRETGRARESLEVYRDAQAIWLKLVAEFNVEDRRIHLGWTDDNIGQLLKEAGRLDEASEVYRQALVVWRKLVAEFNKDDHRNHVSGTLVSLAATLQAEGKRAEAELLFREVESALREDLAMRKQRYGDVHREVERALVSLARVLQQEGKLGEAEAVRREELPMERKLSGDEHPFVARSLAELTSILLAEKKFAEAEPLARECLAIREKLIPDDWRTFNSRSLLGGSLLGQKKYAEAEPVLLSGYEGMKQRDDKIPDNGKIHLQESLQCIVRLYESTGQAEKAAEWKKKLAELDQAEAEKKTAASKP